MFLALELGNFSKIINNNQQESMEDNTMSPEETKKPAGVGEMLGEAGATVKEGVVGSLKGLQEI